MIVCMVIAHEHKPLQMEKTKETGTPYRCYSSRIRKFRKQGIIETNKKKREINIRNWSRMRKNSDR